MSQGSQKQMKMSPGESSFVESSEDVEKTHKTLDDQGGQSEVETPRVDGERKAPDCSSCDTLNIDKL